MYMKKRSLAYLFIIGMSLFYLNVYTARAATIPIYAPETVTNIEGRVYVDVNDPIHQGFLRLGGMSSTAASNIISGWNVGTYTGATTTSPIANRQRGVNNAVPGSTAVQMFGTTAGFIIDTNSIPGTSDYTYGLANAQWGYAWDGADNIRPWASSTSAFGMDFVMKIPIAKQRSNSEPGYVYASILVQDVVSGKSLYLQPQVLDTRYVPYEFYGFDAGTQTAFVGAKFKANGRYASKTTNAVSTKTPWANFKTYGFTINRQQLLNAVSDINSAYASGLSLSPEDYRLILITIQSEVYWGSGLRGTRLATSVRQVNAWTTY